MKKQTGYFRTLTKILLFSGSLSMVPISPLFADSAIYSVIQQSITGSVKDSNGQPLAGATVSVKGTQNKTQSDVNGNFELSNVPNGAVITVTMIGYLNKEVPSNGNAISIVLEDDPQGLDEVVVVGYGSLDKKELTSAVTTIKPKDFVPGTVSPLMSMQGKVAGLNVSSNNGSDPNSQVTLQLRGVNSVNAAQGPLVVIDGVPGGDVNSVAKEDIESISVLRDASAAAIYGTRASGGVILITTKRPQIGKPSVNFTSEYFMESIRRRPQVLSPEKFVEVGLGGRFRV
ncbi:carboxypeptidase-like regulatory domain-containing protein [Sphingobacterium daejeonense]|uniref:carboxypeptidase-like regulatory domain-containing protein n=1 Tax=Sphingobacterium daejeonense TaxID=371142 RepID=UPI0010C36E90|nr:carboxypeptidase-like regulatory domain-containing protein [Sphingobacterium daejeonense]VTP93330.1 outer membrane receptor FepA [Sphingobacterium daejeonense]